MAFESNQMHLNQMQVQMQMSTIQMQVQMQMRPPRGIQMQVQMQMPHLHLQVQMHLHLNTSLVIIIISSNIRPSSTGGITKHFFNVVFIVNESIVYKQYIFLYTITIIHNRIIINIVRFIRYHLVNDTFVDNKYLFVVNESIVYKQLFFFNNIYTITSYFFSRLLAVSCIVIANW